MSARGDVWRPRPRRLMPAVVIAAIAFAVWWALMPLPEVVLPTANLDSDRTTAKSDSGTQVAMDTSGFNVPLWVAPPAPPPAPVAEPPPPPPSPLRLQLIAIVREPDNALSVMLYDPDADRMLSLREGDALPGAAGGGWGGGGGGGGRVIAKITSRGVQIKDLPTRAGREPVIRTLALSDSVPSAPTAEGGR